MARKRPPLQLRFRGLGVLDPFSLEVFEHPAGSGEHYVRLPGGSDRLPLDLAGLNIVGASQALLALSHRWLQRTGRATESFPGGPEGEVRLRLRRREARLLAALLRRHLRRLPEPPEWMPDLQQSLEQIDEFLQWEEA